MNGSNVTSGVERSVVGIDDSPSAFSAMAWAGALQAGSDSTILAVNAFQNPFSEMQPETRDRLVDERRSVLDRAIALLDPDRRTAIEPIVRPGAPGDVILQVAETMAADLIVLGRGGDGRSSPGLLHLDSVAERVVRRSPIPCAVIPSGADSSPGPVTIGVDETSPSRSAISWLAANAAALATEIVAVHVPSRGLLGGGGQDSDPALANRLDRWIEPLRATGIPVRAVLTEPTNGVADRLLAEAKGNGASTVVIGVKAIGEILVERAGGVALSTLHGATLPLLMVPEGPT